MQIRKLTQQHARLFETQLENVREKWEKHLASWGVKWPTSPVKKAQIAGLSFFEGEAVDKDSLGRFVHATVGGALDTQARHLRSDGWYLVGGGRGPSYNKTLLNGETLPKSTYALASLTIPIPSFVQSERLKRQGRVGVRSWAELCALYEGKCAHCGKAASNPIKELDKGHIDPEKGFEIHNLIPLCVDCNNWAANDILFDESGRVGAILSERFLEQTPRQKQHEIYAWLGEKLKDR